MTLQKFICLGLVLLLGALGTTAQGDDPRLVKVGAFNYYPAIFKDSDGQIKGFYVDALADLAERENLRIEYVFGSWNEGLERIKTGEVDLLTSVAYTSERADYMDYTSTPLLTVWGELYVHPDTPFSTIFEAEGKKIAVMKGDHNGQSFIELTRTFNISCSFIELPGFTEVFQAVAQKRVDAGVVNSTFGTAKQLEFGLHSTGVVFNPFNIYFTVAKDKNQDLLQLLNTYLANWRNDKNSVYTQARQKWSQGAFNTTRYVPDWVTYSAITLILIIIIATTFILLLRKQVQQQTRELLAKKSDLKENAEMTRLLLDSTAEGIYGLDPEGTCTMCNAACLAMLGYTDQQQLLGRNMHKLVHHTHDDGSTYDAADCPISGSFKQGKKIHVSGEPFWRADGSSFPVEYWSYPILKQGVVVGAVVTFVDITERIQSVTALRQSEARHRSIFENSRSVMLIIDPESTAIVDANPAAAAFYGWPQDHLRTMRLHEINTLSPEQLAEEMRQARLKNRYYFNFKHRLADGSIRDVEVFSGPITSNDRTLLFSIIHDVTERRRMEETLVFLLQCGTDRSGDDFFQALSRYLGQTLSVDYVCIDRLVGDGLEAQTVAIYHNGVFEDNVHYALSGTPCAEVVGKTVYRVDHAVRNRYPNDAILQELQAESYIGATLWGFDGTPIGLIALVSSSPLPDNSPAETVLQIVAIRAAAELERKLAEEAMLENELRYATLLENAPVAVMINHNNRMILTNKACLKLFGADDEAQLLGKSPLELFHHDDHQLVQERIERLKTSPCMVPSIEETIVRLDGRPVEVEVSAASFPFKGDLAIHVVLQDISDRKQAEQIQRLLEEQLRHAQRMEAIGTLAGGIAHDFNNILTAIIGYAHICQIGLPVDAPQRPIIQHIAEAANRATHLTKDLLLFSRKQSASKRVLELNETLTNTSSFLQRIIGETVQLVTILPPQPIMINADPQQIDQVLMNLATNARDAMPDGGTITISITQEHLDTHSAALHGVPHSGDYAVISVSDTGCGIPDDCLDRIFDPFFTTKEIGQGTGLGLPIVYGIVTEHQGNVRVSSTPGNGTTVTIWLPCTQQPTIAVAEQPTDEALPRGNGETILLAEDSERIRDMASQVLTECGYRVLSAVDGDDALRLFREHQDTIRLLLFDLVMPNKGGFDAYQEIKALKPTIPVLFTTGYAPQVAEGKLSQAQMQLLLHKPFAIVQLLKRVRTALDTEENQA